VSDKLPIFLSLGAGVQSSCCALMSAYGELPHMDGAIFSDTQAEPKAVYAWLGKLEEMIAAAPFPFPVHRVTAGSLTERITNTRTNKKNGLNYYSNMIPAFAKVMVTRYFCAECYQGMQKDDEACPRCGCQWKKETSDWKRGITGRSCTTNFKIEPILKKLRKLAHIKRGQTHVGVIQWIGISLDEATRMSPSREPWTRKEYPLIDAGMTRHDCLRWMAAKGFPAPPRSACVYCPFHSDGEWRRLRAEEPEAFAEAVRVEKAVNATMQSVTRGKNRMRSTVYLHDSMVPLDQVDFSTDEDHGQQLMFQNECQGMCGI
jgi:hypothetical protein